MPVRIHASMRVAHHAAAEAYEVVLIALDRPGGSAGGVATNEGAIPPPTASAKAWNAASTALHAEGNANADASALESAVHAAATVVLGGVIALAYVDIASAHFCAHAARDADTLTVSPDITTGGAAKNAARALCSPVLLSGIRRP